MAQSDPICRLRITLLDVEPAVWRVVEVAASVRLPQLHDVIQRAMGWEDCHLWQFKIDGVEYEVEEQGGFGFVQRRTVSPARVTLEQATGGRRITFGYWYDFGDDWIHKVKVEKVFSPEPGIAYPRCIDGSGACPPEDCGGPWGYRNMLETLAGPESEEREEMLEWLDGPVDPAAFDLEAADAALGPLRRSPSRTNKRRAR